MRIRPPLIAWKDKGRLPSRFFVSTHAIAHSVVVTLMEFFRRYLERAVTKI